MSRLALLFLAVVMGFGGVGASRDKKLAASIDGWGKVIDPDGDCRVALEGAKLKIAVPGAPHDFAAELKRWNAPRVLRRATGDFIAEVKVAGTFKPGDASTIEGRKAYNGAGILLVADNDNHASLQRAAFRDGDHVRHYLNFEVRRAGEMAGEHFDMDIPADADCWLRLERRDGKLYALTSPDSVKWKSYPPIEVDLPERTKIGVEAISSASEPFECTFEKFSLFQSVEAER